MKRIVNEPQSGLFKLRLVKGGPWVAAQIMVIRGRYSAWIGGKRVAETEVPLDSPELMRIWHYGRDIGRTEYEQLSRPDRTVDPTKPVNLLQEKSPF